MKSVARLANNLNVGINVINRIVRQQKIVNCAPSDGKRLINEYQEEHIQQCLILEGYLECYIFESKMHEIQEPGQERWGVFKAKTYGEQNINNGK